MVVVAASAATTTTSTVTTAATASVAATAAASVVSVVLVAISVLNNSKIEASCVFLYLGGLHSCSIFLFNHIDNFVGNSEVLDGRSSNVAFVHPPEMITVSRCADNFLKRFG